MGWDFPKRFLRDRRCHWLPDLIAVAGIWLAVALIDRLWLSLDQTTPAWDAADYLTGSLVYWNALQTPEWFSGQWWTNLWLLSSKIPPLVYISTAPIISQFGKTPDRLMLVFLVYSAILTGSVFGLGTYLFNRRVGLWAVGFCVLMPILYRSRLEYLLDYPLAAMVTLAFLCLTLWREEGGQKVDGGRRRAEGGGPKVAGKEQKAAGGIEEKKEENQDFLEPGTESLLPGTQTPPLPHPPPPALSPLFHRLTPALSHFYPWLLAIAAGITLGLALMTKQSAGLFLLIPIVWCGLETIWQRAWWRSVQFVGLVLASVVVWLPWYRTNWLLILTSSKRATIDSAAIQGSPSLLTLEAWTFYLRYLPLMVSVPLLAVPLIGLVFFWRRSRLGQRGSQSIDYGLKPQDYCQRAFWTSRRALIWIFIFLVGGYFLSSLNPNKDIRYFAPALPVLAVPLAYGFTLVPRSWRLVQWGSVALAGFLMLSALFPIFTSANQSSPIQRERHFPYRGEKYPLEEVIWEVRKTAPYLRSTIGVLPSTPAVNQHNVNFFGLAQNFQVYGRQVGVQTANLTQDRRSLEWFLGKTGEQGSFRHPDIQAAMVKSVEQSGEFKLQKSWTLPDASQLKLYHRQVPTLDVQQIDPPKNASSLPPVQLVQVAVPAGVPSGRAVPITYQWTGSWQDLQRGLVVLTWQRQGEKLPKGRDRWLHDHGIGMGMLFPEQPKPVSPFTHFQVTERISMFLPADLVPGNYELNVVYLNRKTGETIPIPATGVTIQVNPAAQPSPAPEVDLVSQLRSLAGTLPQGPASLEKISNEISRINQYDPVQDYLTQAELAMQYRLQAEPQNPQFAYTLALATVLKRQVNAAIAALERVTQIDPKNPYAHAYLAFVKLYDFRASDAQTTLNTARQLKPDSPEIQALSGIAALMRGNVVQAWNYAQAYQKAEQARG